MSFSDIYRSRRVLVTGHTGFKGSWLTLWLRELGAEVAGYALAPDTEPDLFSLAHVGEGVDHHIGEIRAFEELRAFFDEHQPEIVFHLAAQPLVRRSYREPRQTFETNLGGTVNLLEAVRLTESVRAAVIITTDKCYQNREWLWGYRENDPLGGHDPYSASKAAAELAVAAYRQSFFDDGRGTRRCGVASTRAGNVIGGGDFAEDRILPDAMRALQRETPLEVRSPRSVRPWQHVLEPLSAYLALGQRLLEDPARYAGAWNFGPQHRGIQEVGQLVERFYARLGRGSWRDVSAQQDGAPHEAGLLWLCCDKASVELQWDPVYDTERAIDATADWYRQVTLEGRDARAVCVTEIEAYAHAAAERGAWWTK